MTGNRSNRRKTKLPPRKHVDVAYCQIVGTDEIDDLRPLAAQLVNCIWRNNNYTVETLLHSHGPLSDADMLRSNARLTSVMAGLLETLPACVDLGPDDGDWLHDELRSVFEPDDDLGAVLDGITLDDDDRTALHEQFDRHQLGDHIDGMVTARDSLFFEVSFNAAAPWLTDDIIRAARLRDWGYALKWATWRTSAWPFAQLRPDQWWGMPQWETRVAALIAEFGEGLPVAGRELLVEAPWKLSDEQAWWLIDHYHDGPHARPDVLEGAW